MPKPLLAALCLSLAAAFGGLRPAGAQEPTEAEARAASKPPRVRKPPKAVVIKAEMKGAVPQGALTKEPINPETDLFRSRQPVSGGPAMKGAFPEGTPSKLDRYAEPPAGPRPESGPRLEGAMPKGPQPKKAAGSAQDPRAKPPGSGH